MTTNINIDSKHAIQAAVAWKGPTYFVLIFFTFVFLSFVPEWIKYSRIERQRMQEYTAIKTTCMQAQLQKYGKYDDWQCGRVANAFVPIYR
jgi:hypothetical protein